MNIAEAVQTIKDWTATNAPALLKIIGKPATGAELDKLRKKVAANLPEDFLQWLSLMNGQTDSHKDCLGLIPCDGDPYALYSTKMLELDNDPDQMDYKQKKKTITDPRIQPVYLDPKWIKFAMGGDGTNLAIDLNPTEAGKWGQIILLVDEKPFYRTVLYRSFTDFLCALGWAYKNDEVVWKKGMLLRKENCSFPDLNDPEKLMSFLPATASTTATPKETKAKPPTLAQPERPPTEKSILAKNSILIEIRGRTEVTKGRDTAREKTVTSPTTLKTLSGLRFTDQSIATYLDGNKLELQIAKKFLEGGHIELQWEKQTGTLWVVSSFSFSENLTKPELKVLVDNTVGQWSDGFGTEFSEEIEESHGYFVDLLPYLDDHDTTKPEVIITNPKERKSSS